MNECIEGKTSNIVNSRFLPTFIFWIKICLMLSVGRIFVVYHCSHSNLKKPRQKRPKIPLFSTLFFDKVKLENLYSAELIHLLNLKN